MEAGTIIGTSRYERGLVGGLSEFDAAGYFVRLNCRAVLSCELGLRAGV